MESVERQEDRATRRLRPAVTIKAALLAGLLVFVVPSGGPWMSQEAFTAVMGRIASSNWMVDLIGHFALALIYGWLLSFLIYSPPTVVGILLAIPGALVLYGLNYVTLGLAIGKPGNELHVFLEHLMFALFFAAGYRSMAVQPPRGAPPPSAPAGPRVQE